MPHNYPSNVTTPAEAVAELRTMQTQIIHGSNIFGDIADIIEALEKQRSAAKLDAADYKLQRDALLEMTWLDLPSEPTESTQKWREMFAAGWERKA